VTVIVCVIVRILVRSTLAVHVLRKRRGGSDGYGEELSGVEKSAGEEKCAGSEYHAERS